MLGDIEKHCNFYNLIVLIIVSLNSLLDNFNIWLYTL